ncbi:MAG: DUF348 domain-containing protein [Anaerolineales bacterium]|nr:DUF348 domain-containing protein [Anaerolineales bacterium]
MTRPPRAPRPFLRPSFCLAALLLLLLAACQTSLSPQLGTRAPAQVTLTVDGRSFNVTTAAGNVRELLAEAGITYTDLDLITPPLAEPLTDGLAVSLVRVTESIEVVPQSIPFERRTVRSDAMEAEDPPRIVQAGRAGLQEVRVRITYHDGIEVQRIPIDVTVVEPAVEEILMVGIGAVRSNLRFDGLLAYISDGTAVLLRGSTLFPEQLNTGGPLDGRVFKLSPAGSYLLYTRTSTDTLGFNNSLWLLSTTRGATPRPLGVRNVLWADWNPARIARPEIAFTTAISTNLPPGWEANNDLWLGDVPQTNTADFEPEQLIESYPATFSWWGGNYAWSPDGRAVAYSYANEIGLIDLAAATGDEPPPRRVLQRFTEYNTLADWVWVPTLSWSADGRFLAYTSHNDPDPEAQVFDSWVVDVDSGVNGRFVPQAGMWSHQSWSPAGAPADSRLAFLQAANPLDSQRSSYTLWLMDQDGSNRRQLYPPPGENSRFPREQQFLAWGPDGQQVAFVFSDALHLLSLVDGEAFRITQDDARSSHPTWAPYGQATLADQPGAVTIDTFPTRVPSDDPEVPPE